MTPSGGVAPTWVIAGVPASGSSGGPVRARHVFSALAERTNGLTTTAHGRRGVPSLALTLAARSGGWRRSTALASTQLIPRIGMSLFRGAVRAAVLDVHDHPALQAGGLGFPLTPDEQHDLDRLFAANVDAFARLVVPSATFAGLCQLPSERVLVVPNGADTTHLVPQPPTADPVVGMLSGAAPGRGIELLVHAMELVRTDHPAATLRLALSATGPASAAYLRDLQADLRRRHPWVRVGTVPYPDIGTFLGNTAILVIPHPPHAYLDAATPVKLFDSMAAGRPVVVTPRVETAAIVNAADAGLVAASDRAEDLAASILTLLGDEPRRRQMGENARRAAVELYDWRALANRLADAILGPEDGPA
jgi:glycosyltransferase involved in cell wall biosynthesis